ncbi:hypothetical protein BZA05DRAFT_443704 [Tricharina praecox]|uniref:uncharacterized protein n=1 Tax=Tricharina praecox TaxID=43433 RepID=UPI00221F67F3|nr:uncharacterized protein BZA05DRAFT_443704 [Tricharina praecox]KAI5854181.1 hypothetical protein BZA05DRAFT_443704 [Tricharina praecox]
MQDLITMTDSESNGRELQQQQQQRTHVQSSSVDVSRTRPTSLPATQHTRASSIATSSPAANRNRLSLSFPVLPPGFTPPPRNYSPATLSPSGLITPPNGELDPADSAAFLTALAGQERRVLELKEELAKAETELGKLKRQWATHEANKSRYEISRNSGLTSPSPRGDVSGSASSLASPTSREEFQRRQRATATGRKVLPSQRHQRTLSLLSPERQEFRQPFPRPKDVDDASPRERHLMSPLEMKEKEVVRTQSMDLPTRPGSQEVFIKTGQQIAADFRDGLWTFLEDLKQAVGDDISRPAPPPSARPTAVRKSSSKASLRKEKTGSAALQRRASREGGKSSSSRRGKEREAPAEESLIDFGEDEPSSCSESNFRWSTGSTDSIISPPSRASTPRTSTSSTTSQYKPTGVSTTSTTPPLWNTLSTTPSQFKKHANALLTQVEKSFAIPQEGGETTLARSNSTGCDHHQQIRRREGIRARAASRDGAGGGGGDA